MNVNGAESTLPPELLPEIAKFVGSSTDLLSFSLMNKYAHRFLLPQFYEYLDLKSERCVDGLMWLFARPSIASRVQTLILRPSYDFLVSSKADQHQWKCLLAPALLSVIPYFSALRTFCWDDLIAPDDRIWRSLRINCPQLIAIGSTFGPRDDPRTQQNLFKFSNLHSFSFVPRWHESDFPFPVHYSENPVLSFESYPDEMWTMLLTRSLSLESLTLGVPLSIVHARIFDIAPLFRCVSKWAFLRSLTLGYCHISNEHGHPSDLDFGEFLDAHAPSLRHLSVAGFVSGSPPARRKEHPTSRLTARSVEALETYQGPLPRFVPLLPGSTDGDVGTNQFQSPSALASEPGLNIIQDGVDLLRWRPELTPPVKLPQLIDLRLCAKPICTLHQVREFEGWLRSMTNLESFSVWLDFSPNMNRYMDLGMEHTATKVIDGMLRGIFDNLPHRLRHLEVRCSTIFGMSVLTNAFRSPLPCLRSLTITKVAPKQSDEDMLTTATNIFKSSLFPQLDTLTLRYARHPWSSYKMMQLYRVGVYKRSLAPLNGPHVPLPSQSAKKCSTSLEAEEWYYPYFEEMITLQAQTAWSLKAEENVHFPRRNGSLGHEFSMQKSIALHALPDDTVGNEELQEANQPSSRLSRTGHNVSTFSDINVSRTFWGYGASGIQNISTGHRR